MAITVLPITEQFGAEIGDVDLSVPGSPSDVDAIKEAFWKYAVLVFPGQRLTGDQQLDFAREFGLLLPGVAVAQGQDLRLPRELADVSNISAAGMLLGEESRRRHYQRANQIWHSDASFRFVPAKCSLLYATEIAPLGGDTEFADLRAAYDALPEPRKDRLQGLVARHWLFTSRERKGMTEFTEDELGRYPPVPQTLVRRIAESGRESLYVGSHAGSIFGLPEPDGRALIDELLEHATQPEFVIRHRWRENDLVMWDNRCTLHRGTAYDDVRWRRVMQRATVSDVANTCEQMGVPIPQEFLE